MLKYERDQSGSYTVTLADVFVGSVHKHIGVTVGDPTYWEFNKSEQAGGSHMQLRSGDLLALKEIVSVYIERVITKGLQHA